LTSVGFLFGHAYYASTATTAGQLPALRYLVEEAGCPWNMAAVCKAALSYDNAEMLEWASNADAAVWTTAQLSELLVTAGQNDKLRVAAWLRAAGAEWPTSFFYQRPTQGASLRVWPVRSMLWARANGCPWGLWNHAMCTAVCTFSVRGVPLDHVVAGGTALQAGLYASADVAAAVATVAAAVAAAAAATATTMV
jgi:hypothetical protein